MLRLAFDFIITWRETRTRPNAYLFFKGWLNFSLFKVLELLPTKARHECFEILKLYIKLYIV